VKELRLRGICNMDDGNAFLPHFMADYNRRFGKAPQSDHDAHRPLRDGEKLEQVFLWKEDRRLSGNLTLHYKRMLYLVEPSAEAGRLRGKRVQVCESEDGAVRVTYRGAELAARAFPKDGAVTQATVVDNKLLGGALEEIRQKQLVRDTTEVAGTFDEPPRQGSVDPFDRSTIGG
jgi:hypothetical protein